ncbi:MFS transporter [Nocardiopsis composta]|uniref:Putative MFS family arabinose efflux permease n=1 Tax=Nocardiopsis composta TaxID=157465 RepID=A0A7W8QHP4_9ACTN|nr:MFS transporter [Nocardiopsis composta]MBB5430460.1 putative MFS family arabinose efflux permease [Nocardiopsis composta]
MTTTKTPGGPAPRGAGAGGRLRPGIGRGLLLLMSAATGLAVAGNYFAHPLLDRIAGDLGMGPATAALVVTAAQAGYGAGLLLLVPLGDIVERRRLAVALYAATALFLAVSALAPNGPVLVAGTVLTALTSVAAQVVVGYAAGAAAPQERGRVIGTLMTGLLIGVLLARTASGALSELAGWPTVYWVNAVLMALVAVALRLLMPRALPEQRLSYPALLASTLALFASEPLLRWRAAIGAVTMAAFSLMWTALTLLLAGPSYGWSEASIGLVGLLGVAGAATATVAGRLADRGRVQAVSGAGVALLLVAWAPLLAGGGALAPLLLGVLLVDSAQQAVLNSSQNVIYALRPEVRNRLNSAYMTCYFAGGAVGSALTAAVWTGGGWTGVSALGAALSAAGLVLWLLERRAARPR